MYALQPDGSFRRSMLRRRPGTLAVASAIMHRYNIKVVPHLVCSGFTAADIEYMLLDLQFLGINEVFALRGDKAPDERQFQPMPGGYTHATELIGAINRFNDGHFIDGSEIKVKGTPFTYGVAAYPEKHDEAPNLQSDISVLKLKQDLGARYAVTQLFYDNQKYYDFVAQARAAGVTIPIIPALKPLNKRSQLNVVPKTFHVDIPQPLADAAREAADDAHIAQIGVEWGVQQCRDLEAHGIDAIHFYTYTATDSIRKILTQL